MNKKQYEKLDIELNYETYFKVRVLCKRRGLRFPEGIIILLKEVAQPEKGCKARSKAGTVKAKAKLSGKRK